MYLVSPLNITYAAVCIQKSRNFNIQGFAYYDNLYNFRLLNYSAFALSRKKKFAYKNKRVTHAHIHSPLLLFGRYE